MTPYFPDVEITWPTASHAIPTTQTSEMIYYTSSNITAGYWTLDGINIGALNINGASVQITGLQYGNNSICIVGLGLSNLVDYACINIWRDYPPVVVVINNPADGSIIYGQNAIVSYSTANVTSANWLLDGMDVGAVQLSQSSRTFPVLSWGTHTICIRPFGLDGQHFDVCTSFTMVAPPLDVQITSPANGSSVPADQVTIGYIINNATEGNWTLNGISVSSVTLWNQQMVILNLQLEPNIICIEAYGENNQHQIVCITIIGHNLDSDLDGVPDHSDNCSDTPVGTIVTLDGCTDPTSDIDQDSVPDLNDTCPDTPNSEIADENGCGPSQRDSDNDGINDADDICNNTAVGASIDETGCANSQIDSDGDGTFDDVDAFPQDPTQTTDSDGDGYGDDINGNNPDFFPADATQWHDFDRDGWGDNPQGNDPDACPTIAGVENGVPGKGCPAPPDDNNTGTNNTGTNNTGTNNTGTNNTGTNNTGTNNTGANNTGTNNTDDNNTNQTDDNGLQTSSGGEFKYMQLATIVGIFMVILFATMAILRVRKKGDEEEHLLDEYNEQEQTFTDLQNDIPKQEEPSSEQSSGLDSQNTECEWQEHPVGTGHWYYRNPGEEDWTYYEQ
jgi:hypothetical protein